VVCLYAIYHLIRNPKARPAGSSASYHFFALVTDAGFIPFYVFTILLARRNSDMEAGTVGRWRTMFPTVEDTDKVLMTTWLTATATAGLHLLSACLDMYLATIFRKISKLPPDMNPLEDNLTSRRKTKHKHKNSSISAITPLTSDQEKRFSDQSTIAGDRNSQYQDIPSPTKNQVAFMHTRTDSENTYSPHTPASARQSKERFSMYSQPPSAYQSRKDLNHRNDLLRNDDDDDQTLAQRKSMLSEQANIKRHSRNDSYLTNSSKNDFYTPPSTGRPGTAHTTNKAEPASGDLSLQRNSRETLQQDNWFVHPDEQEEHCQPAPVPKSSFLSPNKNYNSVSQYDDASDVSDYEVEVEEPMMPQPLRTGEESQSPRMNPLSQNPPTPPPTSNFSLPSKSTPPPRSPGLQRTLTTTTISTEKTFDRSHSRSGTPKSRYYGNLQAATKGVRSGTSPSNSPSSSPTKNPSFRNVKSNLPSAASAYTSNAPPVPQHTHNNLLNSPFTLHKKSYTSIKRQGETGYTPIKGQSPRVISRSGVDYMNPYEFDDSDLGTIPPGRRRDVSGKVAEEGRGGAWSGMKQRQVSGVA
jgi:hypothetical protein